MMIEQDDEHIDKSQWVEWDYRRDAKGNYINPMIKPEREAKGDMKIECFEGSEAIQFAQSQVRNILNFLWNREIITDEQKDAGWCFKAWRDQHRVAMGQERAISGDIGEPTTGVKLRAYGYVLLTKRLHILNYKAIDFAVEKFESDHNRFCALQSQPAYKRAFTQLEEILQPVKDQIAYLEGLSDDERSAMSDEALKNFLATIVKFV